MGDEGTGGEGTREGLLLLPGKRPWPGPLWPARRLAVESRVSSILTRKNEQLPSPGAVQGGKWGWRGQGACTPGESLTRDS